MKATLRKIGNSQGVLIPKAIIGQVGIENELEMTVEHDTIVLRRPEQPHRAGWAEASRLIAENQDDALVWPEFGNAEDRNLTW